MATTGRPGPVLVDVPKDVSNAHHGVVLARVHRRARPARLPAPDRGRPRARSVRRPSSSWPRSAPSSTPAAASSRPTPPRRCGELAERTGIPVVTTLMARGAFPDRHPLCLGMPGMHGNYTAVTAMQRADLLIALGSRFDDRVTGKISAFAPEAKVIHVDIDPAELGKVRPARRRRSPGDCRRHGVIDGDSSATVPAPGWLAGDGRRGRPSAPGATRSRAWQEEFPSTYDPPEEGGALKPQSWSRRCGTPPPTTPSSWPAWASTRCGPRSTGSSTTPTPGSTPAGGHHGLRRARRDRGQGGPARQDGVGHRRRRLLPDDRPGAGDGLQPSASPSRWPS